MRGVPDAMQVYEQNSGSEDVTFAELLRRGGEDTALGDTEGEGNDSGVRRSHLRRSALRDGETRDLVARLLENAVLNLVRETTAKEFEPSQQPVQVIRM